MNFIELLKQESVQNSKNVMKVLYRAFQGKKLFKLNNDLKALYRGFQRNKLFKLKSELKGFYRAFKKAR